MELTNEEMIKAHASLNFILKERLPVKVGWEIARIVNKLEDTLIVFNKVREGLMEKHNIKIAKVDGELIITSFAGNGGKALPEDNLTDEDEEIFEQRKGCVKGYLEEVTELGQQTAEIAFNKATIPSTLEIEGLVLVPLGKFLVIEDKKE